MDINTNRQRQVLALMTFSALAFLLGVHVVWLFKAASLEERIFNQRVAIALKEARDEIGIRLGKCVRMNDYLCGEKMRPRGGAEQNGRARQHYPFKA